MNEIYTRVSVRKFDSYVGEIVFTDGVRIAVVVMAKLDFMEK